MLTTNRFTVGGLLLVVVAAALVAGATSAYLYQGYTSWKVERNSIIYILNENIKNGRLLVPKPGEDPGK